MGLHLTLQAARLFQPVKAPRLSRYRGSALGHTFSLDCGPPATTVLQVLMV
jgi:hypothetical protein